MKIERRLQTHRYWVRFAATTSGHFERHQRMRIVHRICFNGDDLTVRRLQSIGLNLHVIRMPGNGQPFVSLDLPEDHPNWPALRRLFDERDAFAMVRTEFSKQEIQAAHWLEMEPVWHHGYPQPRDDEFGYLEATYDMARYCVKCGIGKVQNAPFQMKGEPKWGTRSILQMHWVFDEYFVTPDVWETVFRPLGVACRPVLNRRLKELQTVVQLVAEEEVSITTDGLATDHGPCTACGRVKYLPITRGPFPPVTSTPKAHIAKTRESIGSGAPANNGVIVSQVLRRNLLAEKIRGAHFKPVAA